MDYTLKILLLRLWKQVDKKRRRQLFFFAMLMIFSSFAEVISIGAVLPFLSILTNPETIFTSKYAKPFIQIFQIESAENLLLPITIIFVIALLLSGLFRFLLLWTQTRLCFAIGAQYSIGIYRRTLYQPYTAHISRNSSQIISSISNKANEVTSQVLMPILTIISSLFMLIMILSALIVVNPFISIISVAGFGSIYLIIIKVVKKRLIKNSIIISQESNKVIKALQEGLGGIRDVLIDGTQETYCKYYENSDIPLRKAKANINIMSGSPRFGIEALGMILIVLLSYSLASKSENFATVIPIIGVLVLGAQRMLPVLQLAYSSWTSILGSRESLKECLDILDTPLPKIFDRNNCQILKFENQIRLHDVSFNYLKNSTKVLKNVNLTIRKGSITGIIGTTGSGKSTLLDIIMGLIEPTQGDFFIDDLKINTFNCREWQRQLSHVPQHIFLSDNSIAENIAFGIPLEEIDLNRVKHAARKAQIFDTIEELEDKYHTKVGERGIKLSGGQRQRIGIARALYKESNVIIFDEATSALDNETENNVMESIENLGNNLTIIIVAHRLTTLKKCDQIIVLKEGTVDSIVKYDELDKHFVGSDFN